MKVAAFLDVVAERCLLALVGRCRQLVQEGAHLDQLALWNSNGFEPGVIDSRFLLWGPLPVFLFPQVRRPKLEGIIVRRFGDRGGRRAALRFSSADPELAQVLFGCRVVLSVHVVHIDVPFLNADVRHASHYLVALLVLQLVGV